MPRLFAALEIPSPVAAQLSFLQVGMPGVRWVEPENFHITLRFIGDIDRPLALELANSLEHVQTTPFSLKLENLDVFGRSKPHSLYARVQRTEALLSLKSQLERVCQRLQIDPDPRRFTPHVTLARVRGVNPKVLATYLSGHGGYQSEDFGVSRFVLMSSRDSVGGGPYVKEATYELVRRDNAIA